MSINRSTYFYNFVGYSELMAAGIRFSLPYQSGLMRLIMKCGNIFYMLLTVKILW